MKYDTCLELGIYFLFEVYKMESEKGIDIGVVQDFREENLGCEEGENIGENVLDSETDSESRGDRFTDFNLNLSLDIVDTEAKNHFLAPIAPKFVSQRVA